MKHILTIEQMRKADKEAIDKYAISSPLLMENAAHSSANYIRDIISDNFNEKKNAIFFCGSGNNGGDGYAIARHLFEEFNIFIFWLGDKEKMSSETLANFESCEKLGIYMQHIRTQEEANHCNYNAHIIVDAMIGVGAGENLKGLVLPILENINNSQAIKIAIDIPTGLNAETGICHPSALKADHTITMFALKTGMLKNQGKSICGEINIADLGAPLSIVSELSDTKVFEEKDLHKILKLRNRNTSKFNYGRVLVIAGSENMPGAAALCANACISTGAGLVELMTTQTHSALFPEIMPTLLKKNEMGGIAFNNIDIINNAISKATVLAIGPGFGASEDSTKLVKYIIEKYKNEKIMVIDADALRAINIDSKLTPNIILTPHEIEFSKMFDIPIFALRENPEKYVRKYAEKLNCIILLKGVPTIIANSDSVFYNINGNPGMATAGSGDVLTGIIASISAQKISTTMSAVVGAFVHSATGDIIACEKGEYSITASKLIDNLWKILP